jgi:hypothetical protein
MGQRRSSSSGQAPEVAKNAKQANINPHTQSKAAKKKKKYVQKRRLHA